jgi:hypothetical protein
VCHVSYSTSQLRNRWTEQCSQNCGDAELVLGTSPKDWTKNRNCLRNLHGIITTGTVVPSLILCNSFPWSSLVRLSSLHVWWVSLGGRPEIYKSLENWKDSQAGTFGPSKFMAPQSKQVSYLARGEEFLHLLLISGNPSLTDLQESRHLTQNMRRRDIQLAS